MPYLNGPALEEENAKDEARKTEKHSDGESGRRRRRSSVFKRPTLKGAFRGSFFDLLNSEEVELVANEERLIFIKALKSAYHYLIENGEVESRGFLPYSLFESLDYAQDKAARGQPLADWDDLCVASNSIASQVPMVLLRVKHLVTSRAITLDDFYVELEHFEMLFVVEQLLAFIKAHKMAEKTFKEFSEGQGDGKGECTRAENIVLEESFDQVLRAEQTLDEYDEKEVQQIKSHYACRIILNKAAAFYEKLARQGLMTEREAGEFIEETETNIRHLNVCRASTHAGELSEQHKMEMMPSDGWGVAENVKKGDKSVKENVKEDADEEI